MSILLTIIAGHWYCKALNQIEIRLYFFDQYAQIDILRRTCQSYATVFATHTLYITELTQLMNNLGQMTFGNTVTISNIANISQ